VLPSLRARAFSVSPSAAAWLRAEQHRASGRGVVLVAGPDLPGAEAEVAALARLLPGARVLTGAAAAADAVRRAIDGAALVHIAAHGNFRVDNPLFSSLRLADGPLTVHDLERLERAPDVLVLSACDSGRSATRPGEEVMGLAAALLALGTASAVTSVLPVPDAETAPFMLAFHGALVAGAAPGAALARARADAVGAGEASASMVVASSFACFGA
jgi:CHAT domain-containing protein